LEQAELLDYVVRALDERAIPYLIVGSIASMAYGEPRLTRDIDIIVDLRPEHVESLCAAFPADEFYVSLPAARQAVARRHQFNVIHPTSGNKIDFMIARTDAWGREQLARGRKLELQQGTVASVAAPEDVILSKLLYYREGHSDKHLRDVAAMLQVSGDEIDSDYIARWAQQLGVTEIWRAILDRLADSQAHGGTL
jgi:hypothetical protein